eukprot:gene6134-2451_t
MSTEGPVRLSLREDAGITGAQHGILRPRGMQGPGHSWLVCDACGKKHLEPDPSHQFTACRGTARDRHVLVQEMAKDLARISGSPAKAITTRALAEGQALLSRRMEDAHAIEWNGHSILILN